MSEDKDLMKLMAILFIVSLILVVAFITYPEDIKEPDYDYMEMTSMHLAPEPKLIDNRVRILCIVNEERIDCNDFPGDEHFCEDGVCVMNGVCPGVSNKSHEECLIEAKNAWAGVK